jgi:hypothetical protein
MEAAGGDLVELDDWDQKPIHKVPDWELPSHKVWVKPETLKVYGG